ncbi:2-oxo-4-hydroxy-4-carboxy-5-ureidoimidazoline decarboxylase [Hydrogenophaga atypica]|uniref:2-oxo-4-hydroxy-4-carboxy-5-ureidoimidazoline decarboxylase n=1 Tax=Hydrogenophaga atypica TaxID=249409 RepID=A0ABW2QJP4_9BURK
MNDHLAVDTLLQLNAMTEAEFASQLADVFEHSPWVAQRAARRRPFSSVEQLHHAMCKEMQAASLDEQLALLRAHPELAGREAQAGELTAASTHEQARAGLNALSAVEMRRITALNQAYRQQHGFPFIVCVGQHTKASLFDNFARRASNPTDAEREEALAQVEAIALLRLQRMLAA